MNLGYEIEECSPGPCDVAEQPETKIRFPSFCVSDHSELAAELVEQQGKEITAIVKLRIVSIEVHAGDSYGRKAGSRIEFEVIDLEPEETKTKPEGVLDRIKTLLE